MSDPVLFMEKKSKFLRIPENIATYFTEATKTGITKFFENHPNFDIREESVKATAGLDVDQEVINGLCDMLRTLPLASNSQEFHLLMTSQLTSAFKIASMSVKQLMATAWEVTARAITPPATTAPPPILPSTFFLRRIFTPGQPLFQTVTRAY